MTNPLTVAWVGCLESLVDQPVTVIPCWVHEPAFVLAAGCEVQPRAVALDFLLRLGGDQSGAGQGPGDGGPRDGDLVVGEQVPSDGLRAGAVSLAAQVFTQLEDQLDRRGEDGLRACLRMS